jgi:hypothetical protein
MDLNLPPVAAPAALACAHVMRHYDALEEHLVRYIECADAVVGSMAWLTSARVLAALARKRHVGIAVHADAWLATRASAFAEGVRAQYAALPALTGAPFLAATLLCGAQSDAVRCVGAGAARMHRKCIIFLRADVPYASWSGSYNATRNASRSLEEALYIENADLARADFAEWTRVFARSAAIADAHRWLEAPPLVAAPVLYASVCAYARAHPPLFAPTRSAKLREAHAAFLSTRDALLAAVEAYEPSGEAPEWDGAPALAGEAALGPAMRARLDAASRAFKRADFNRYLHLTTLHENAWWDCVE